MARNRLAAVLLALWATVALSSRDPEPQGVIKGTGHTVGYGELAEEWRGEIINLSWSPRAFLLKGFLSDEEADHLKNKAEPRMRKSSVVDNKTGKSVASDIRTSTGMFFEKGEDEIIRRVEKRVSQVTMVPVEHQEGIQVLHYHDGQKYEPHYDYFHDPVNAAPSRGGQRLITMLIYLTTPTEGGETVFPNAADKSTGPEWSKCAQQGLAVKAYKGDALMFYSLKPDGSTDTASLHGSCPTLQGDKWSATKWIHVGPVGGPKPKKVLAEGECADANEQCKEWSYFGECEKNPGFMHPNCKKSCKLC